MDSESWAGGVAEVTAAAVSSSEHGHGQRPGKATCQRAMEKHADLADAVILEESLPGWNLSLPSHYNETGFPMLLTFRRL